MSNVRYDKPFVITSVCRDDLVSIGFSKSSVGKITDMEMRYLARKMADAYCDCCFWIALETIAVSLKCKLKKVKRVVV